MTLNGEDEEIQNNKRTQACLKELRRLREAIEAKDGSAPKLSKMHLVIVSENNFPTAAGLASSAAGFAALVRAIANLYELPQSPKELSLIARQGSGSACRSLMGGFVAWRAGSKDDGTDSLAEEVAPASHWPEIRALILVVSPDKKAVGSTLGMQTTVQTSTLFPERASTIVPRRMREMEKAIEEKDFESFAKITMQDSNSFHACCLDSWPPIQYLTDASRSAMDAVHTANRKAGKLIAAYTFDAGPNAVIYYLEENAAKVAGVFRSLLPMVPGWDSEYGKTIKSYEFGGLESKSVMIMKSAIARVICTGVGEGPVEVDQHLVAAAGKPVLAAG